MAGDLRRIDSVPGHRPAALSPIVFGEGGIDPLPVRDADPGCQIGDSAERGESVVIMLERQGVIR